MAKQRKKKLHKNVLIAYQRLMSRGGLLCRQSSTSDEASEGGGFLYFDAKAGKPLPPKSSLFLIQNRLVEPVEDGLFAGASQTFSAIDRDRFEMFKEQYERVDDVQPSGQV